VSADWPDGVLVYPGVDLGAGCDLQPPCVIGAPAQGGDREKRALVIGAGAVVGPFATIVAGSTVGERLRIGRGASIGEGNSIGDDCTIGPGSVLERGNRIGSRVRIHAGCFLELVTLEDDVFVGPNVVFLDDPHPMGCPRWEDCRGGVRVERLARVGAGSIILPGVRVGQDSVVAAGSVVAEDVIEGMVVAGNPARTIKRVSELRCDASFFERPYLWPPYTEPQLFDPGEACEEVIDRVHVAERYRPPSTT
jgi:acetyltransferase-like isoleucine patch superfamily enzyme